MGKHVRGVFYLPAGAKPRHRFVIAFGTIVLLAFATMAIVAVTNPQSGPSAAAQPERPDPGDDVFGGGPPFPGQAGGDAAHSDTPPSADPSVAGFAGLVVAVYSVPPTAVWSTGFQAQAAMTNTSAEPQDWQVRLTFPDGVTGLAGSWVDGAPHDAQAAGHEFTFTGSAPIPPGRTVVLKVQLTKEPDTVFAPRACTVNGRACALD